MESKGQQQQNNEINLIGWPTGIEEKISRKSKTDVANSSVTSMSKTTRIIRITKQVESIDYCALK